MTREVINICHIASGDLYYGAEVQIYNIIKASIKNQFLNVSAIIMNNNVLYKKLKELGINVFLIDETKLSIATQIISTIKILHANKIKVVHTHRYKEDILGALGKFFLLNKIKLIRTQHGSFSVIAGISPKRAYLYWFLDLIFTKVFFNKVIGVSEDIAKQFGKYINPSKISTIHNSIDVTNYSVKSSPQPTGFTNRPLIVSLIGRLEKVKNVEEFLKIVYQIKKVKISVQAYIVGDGPEYDSLVKIAGELGLTNVVTFTGKLDNISDIMNKTDIFFITSLHEGIPTVLLEAMYFKKIIVTKPVGGIKEVINDGVTGFFYKTVDDAFALVKKIYKNPNNFKNYQLNARKKIEDEYTQLIQITKYIKEYEVFL